MALKNTEEKTGSNMKWLLIVFGSLAAVGVVLQLAFGIWW